MQTATKEVMTENRDRQISYRVLQPKFSHLVERNGGAATVGTHLLFLTAIGAWSAVSCFSDLSAAVGLCNFSMEESAATSAPRGCCLFSHSGMLLDVVTTTASRRLFKCLLPTAECLARGLHTRAAYRLDHEPQVSHSL